jgi:hypothetical protein
LADRFTGHGVAAASRQEKSRSCRRMTRWFSSFAGALRTQRSGNLLSNAYRSRGRPVTSVVPVIGSCARKRLKAASSAEGASRSCTFAAMSLRAVSAVGWGTRASPRTRSTGVSGERGRSEGPSVAGRASSTSSRTSRQICAGGAMVGCSIRPRRSKGAGSLFRTNTCAAAIQGGNRSKEEQARSYIGCVYAFCIDYTTRKSSATPTDEIVSCVGAADDARRCGPRSACG